MAHDEVWSRDWYGRTYRLGFHVDDDECVSLDEHVLADALRRGGYQREV